MPKGNKYARNSTRSPNGLLKKSNVMAPTSYGFSEVVSMNTIKQNKPTMLIAKHKGLSFAPYWPARQNSPRRIKIMKDHCFRERFCLP